MTDRFQFVMVPGLWALVENRFFFTSLKSSSQCLALGILFYRRAHLGPVLILLEVSMHDFCAFVIMTWILEQLSRKHDRDRQRKIIVQCSVAKSVWRWTDVDVVCWFSALCTSVVTLLSSVSYIRNIIKLCNFSASRYPKLP